MSARRFDDTLDVRFRLRAVHVGVGLSVVCGAVIATYALATWERPHRTALLLVALAAILLGGLAERLPWATIARRRAAELAFVTWSVVLVGWLAAAAALDGGVRSPLTFALFLPLAYVATSYPTRSVLTVGVVDLLALAGLVAIADGVPWQDAATVGALLTLGAVLCVWQARNHARRQGELARVSRADPLTGALNRHGLRERLDGEVSAADRTARPLALVLVDVDEHEPLVQTAGYEAGDELLRWSAGRLRDLLRPSDALGRASERTFAIVAPTAGRDEADIITGRIVAALAERTTVTVGVAAFPHDATTADGVQAAADTALAQARAGAAADERDLGWAAALARAVDLRLAVTSGDAAGVGRLAVELGGRLGLRDDDLSDIRLAGSLCAIGRSAVPGGGTEDAAPSHDDILAARRRTHEAAELVRRIPEMRRTAEWIGASLEHWDGTGYPDGRAGAEIPLPARILHVASAFDALTRRRRDDRGVAPADALREIEAERGRRFDPAVVDALGEIVAAGVVAGGPATASS